MARKVFISVLGTNHYVPTRYHFGDKPLGNEKSTHFVQEATMNYLCKEWTDKDAAYIFVTKEAKEKNWDNPAQKGHKYGEYPGLSEVIKNLNFKFKTEPVDIGDGFSEEEIWDIFQTVFDKLNQDDELYFDITHSFRSLPMLIMVLINYAKFLKSIKVKGIYYGAFEKLGPSYKVKEMPEKERFAKVLNLTAFSELQDWTGAANDFVNFGNADKLSTLTKQDLKPFAIKFKGSNETINNLNKLSKLLPKFINNIETCRGKEIIKNEEGTTILESIANITEDFIYPLNPLIKKIEKKIFPFKNKNNLINGFNAVKWCLDHNLIQQGFTILQENIISLIMDEMNWDNVDLKKRNIISSSFKIKSENISEDEWIGDAALFPELTKEVLKKSMLIKILYKEYLSITDLRNDLNHAGYRKNTVKAAKFKEFLSERYYTVLSKIQLSC